MRRPRIGVVGSNMVDLIAYAPRMPVIGETLEAPSFEMGFGGKGANRRRRSILSASSTSEFRSRWRRGRRP